MSGQFPGGYSSPMGGHRGNFGNQMVNMNQMGMMAYNQGGMINQQQQAQMQSGPMGMNPQGMGHGVGDLQNPSHAQQQTNQQTLQQQQMQQQLQQQQQQMQQQQLQQQQQQQQQAPQLTLQTASTPTPTGTMMSQQNIQQQQPQTGMLTTSAPQLPQKEINTVSLTKLGQETVQDITSRFQEIFSALKTIQPTGNRENNTEKKVQEYFRTIRLLFKRLRIIYEKSNDGCSQGMEYTHVESLIPYKDEPEQIKSESAQCEEYKKALQENRELIETVMLKNKQLREIIDRTRIIIWEINTMLSMRRS